MIFLKKKTKIQDLKNLLKYLETLRLAEVGWWEFAGQIENQTIDNYQNFINKNYNLYVQKFQKELILLKISEKIKRDLKLVLNDEFIKKLFDELAKLNEIFQAKQKIFKSYIEPSRKPSIEGFLTLINFLKQDHGNNIKTFKLIESLIYQIEQLDKSISNNKYEKKILEIAEIIDSKYYGHRFKDLFEEAVKAKDFKIQDGINGTLLSWSCLYYPELVLKLIKLCPEAIKIANSNDETPLYLACKTKNIKLAIELAKIYSEAIKIANGSVGRTPLYWACGTKNIKLAMELAKLCPEAIKITDNTGRTPVNLVCENKNNDEFIIYVYKNNLFLESNKEMIEKYLDMQSISFSKKIETILNKK